MVRNKLKLEGRKQLRSASAVRQSAGDFLLQDVQNFLDVLAEQHLLLSVDNAELNLVPALDGGVELSTGYQVDPLFHVGVGFNAKLAAGMVAGMKFSMRTHSA